MKRWGRGCLLWGLAVGSAYADYFQKPDFVLSEAFEDTHPNATGGAPCRMLVALITDARSERTTVGNVAGRPVRPPADVDAWLRNVISALSARGVDAVLGPGSSPDAQTLVADMELKIAWLSSVSTSKSTTFVWHLRLRRGDTLLVDKHIRGADTVVNWSSRDAELQRAVNRALGKSLDLMAGEIRAQCAAGS